MERTALISVLASVHVKPGRLSDLLREFEANVGHVLAEKGCIEYYAAVDIETGIGVQVLDPDLVTVIEKWESLEALRAHLAAPHMATYRDKVKDIVDRVTLKVLRAP